jgi:hypothetical protein
VPPFECSLQGFSVVGKPQVLCVTARFHSLDPDNAKPVDISDSFAILVINGQVMQ